MKPTEQVTSSPLRAIPFADFTLDERETFQGVCKWLRKDPDDFKVEGHEHTPDAGASGVHRDVVVRYLPTGKARRYCPDYGRSWLLKFATDLEVHYFTPQDAPELRGFVVLS